MVISLGMLLSNENAVKIRFSSHFVDKKEY
jgi:hypothetical protein